MKNIADLKLSPAETEVAQLVLLGLSNQEIADERFTHEKATKYNITNIFKKAGVKTRAQFIVEYLEAAIELRDARAARLALVPTELPAGV